MRHYAGALFFSLFNWSGGDVFLAEETPQLEDERNRIGQSQSWVRTAADSA
jgi:hypothetical protein